MNAVPVKVTKRKQTIGAKKVMWLGFFLKRISAHLTKRSRPPEHWRVPASEVTARMINITAIGGLVGLKPQMNVKMAKPNAPAKATAMPPFLTPIRMHRMTISASIINMISPYERLG